MKKIYYAILICLFLGLGCGGEVQDYVDKQENEVIEEEDVDTIENTVEIVAEEGLLSINMKLSKVDSDYIISKINIVLTKDDFLINRDVDVYSNIVSSSFENLEYGTYDIKLLAYNDNVVVAMGEGEATIYSNEVSSVTIVMNALPGNLDITIELPVVEIPDEIIVDDVEGTFNNPYLTNIPTTMPDGWVIKVLNFDSDAWPEVEEENMFNDPPNDGKRMVMVRLSVINQTTESPNFIWKYDFYMVGSLNTKYSTFGTDSSCGVIPDGLDEDLYTGGEGIGNACFQVGINETNLRIAYEYDYDKYVYFNVE